MIESCVVLENLIIKFFFQSSLKKWNLLYSFVVYKDQNRDLLRSSTDCFLNFLYGVETSNKGCEKKEL